jgi:hypothetical protein
LCAQEEERIKSSPGESAHLVKDNKKILMARVLNHKGNLSGIRKKPLPPIHRERNPRILRINSMVDLKKISASTASRRDTTRGIVQTF